MADGLEVLLRTWNQAIYRYGSFDFDKLESCIGTNIGLLTRFRAKNILDAIAEDEQQIKELFEQFLTALARADGNKSPVAAAKALHLLAPDFFPLWDKQIALAYGLDYSRQPIEKFVAFCKASQSIARQLRPLIQLPSRKTLLKLIDEYNYAKYTKQWI
jgi:hypothetical protein